jgi:uncharacterized SAM-binding protein YcdF (DUF218 family)
MNRNRLKFGLFATIFIALSVASLGRIPYYLYVEKPTSSSDLIIVLSGNAPNRVDHATQLYHQGVAPKILISGGPFYDTNEAQIMRDYAVKRGIKKQDIYLETQSKSTVDNAVHSLEIIATLNTKRISPIKKIIVVTSGFHSYRSYQVFRSIFPESYQLYSMPSEPMPSKWVSWWTNTTQIEVYAIEFLKLIFYAFYYL